MSRIKDRIKDHILCGSEAEKAYARAVEDIRNLAPDPGRITPYVVVEWGLDKLPPQDLPDDSDLDPIIKIVVGGGGAGDVPSASCIAAFLKDIPSPTPEDIERAFLACSGQAVALN